MTQVCNQCSRANPSDASYCYFDGVRLAGSGNGGPVNAATQNFPTPFVFPSGQSCRNFDQLAMACQQHWQAAVDLLKSGFLSNFFGGLGRADLALAAQEAARFPDQDRGLDQLLAKIPSQALQPPKIKIEPSDINLGQVDIGADRTIELHLANQGMRLVYGSIASDCKWVTLGDPPGTNQKLFQFGTETTVPLHIRGQHLRAGTKPLEGQLLIESNAGTATINVKAMVPITPFKEGVLAGSLTPRQIAEKAKANPAGAAPLFESGAVAKWFQSNGWIYPVQGPSANGIGAVQQFFEALGLAKAPKVEISTQAITLKGNPGQSVQTTLQVTTPEKKPVYAHATCDQAWVDVSKVKLAGRQATIQVAVASVPSRPNETLKATIHVQGNGNQRFTVPLTLTIGAGAGGGAAGGSGAAPELALDDSPFAAMGSSPAPAKGGSGSPFEGFYSGSAPIVADVAPASTAVTAAPSAKSDPSISVPRKAKQHYPSWVHLAPLIVLFLALLGVLLRDFFGAAPAIVSVTEEEEVENDRRLALLFDYQKDNKPLKAGEPKIVNNNLNFGLFKLDASGEAIRLFYGDRGNSNNVLVDLNGTYFTFGKPGTGKWEGKPVFKENGCVGTWKISDSDVQVTQDVSLIPGEPVEVSKDVFKRYRDNCLVKYKIENKSSRVHKVGMRISLDTYIGMNDGVPFTIPGMKGLMATSKEFKTADEVPDFIMALENASLDDPRTVAQLNLRLGGKLEAPSRVMLTRWNGATQKKLDIWEIPLKDIGDDSSVVLYWPSENLDPGKTRELGYTYGLGSLSSSKGGQVAVTVGGSFVVGGELSVVALVNSAKGDEKATLKFDKEFSLISGPETQAVPPAHKDSAGKLRPAPITWRIRSSKDGAFNVRVETSSGAIQTKRVVIRKTSIF